MLPFEKQIKTIKNKGQKQDAALRTLELKDNEEQQIEAVGGKSDDHDDKISTQIFF